MAIPRISELPATLASQIAAGEVIERPAAIVKELLDNSIDAGADNVTVSVLEGGHKLISVSDNGHGIHPDDIELALRRHSTSKLNAQSDLDCITSLGFRGEAPCQHRGSIRIFTCLKNRTVRYRLVFVFRPGQRQLGDKTGGACTGYHRGSREYLPGYAGAP